MIETDFGIIPCDIEQPLRIDEADVLFLRRIDPEDVIRIEVTGLEETDPRFAFVTQEIEGFSVKFFRMFLGRFLQEIDKKFSFRETGEI